MISMKKVEMKGGEKGNKGMLRWGKERVDTQVMLIVLRMKIKES